MLAIKLFTWALALMARPIESPITKITINNIKFISYYSKHNYTNWHNIYIMCYCTHFTILECVLDGSVEHVDLD